LFFIILLLREIYVMVLGKKNKEHSLLKEMLHRTIKRFNFIYTKYHP
jgi:hypothetical protein